MTEAKNTTAVVVHEAAHLDPDTIRQEILTLIEQMGRDCYRLGNKLWEVKEGELYLKWGYASWEEYAEIEIGYKSRACRDYMSIASTLDRTLGIPWDNVKHIVPRYT